MEPMTTAMQRALPASLFLVIAHAGLCAAGIGLTGIDSFENKPFCATACYGSLSSYRLDCSVVHGDEDDHHAHVMTSPECRADNDPFLASLAWCIKSKCEEVDERLTTSEIEEFWERTSTGDPNVKPHWSYTQALANVSEPPTVELGHGGTVNTTVITPFFWNVLYGTYTTLYQESWNMNVFGYVLTMLSESRKRCSHTDMLSASSFLMLGSASP